MDGGAQKPDEDIGLQAMIDQGPEWLDRYLVAFERGAPLTGSMIGIEAGAASKAFSEQSLEWAAIAVRAGQLYAREDGGRYRAFALLRVMGLRAWFIAKMGSQVGHPVLDRDIILSWFRAETDLSIDDAKERSARWRREIPALMNQLPPEINKELARLRSIRQHILVLKMLADCGELPDEPYFNEWLGARDEIV